jgi:uncharacterized 2Fe-2S/4Fe-4S cluster protein (DUF4445 family)
MSVLRDIPIEIDESAVAKLLNGGDKHNSEIDELIAQEIKNCLPLLKPEIIFEEIGIRAVETDKVYLKNGVVFEGDFISKNLAACSAVAVTVCTLGADIDEYVRSCFESGDYLRGMTADAIAVTALGNAGKQLWDKLTDSLKGTNLGITSRLSPGDTDWELKEQKKIFDCLHESNFAVTLLESGMMLPVKSASAVYGFGKGIGIKPYGHVCSQCKLKNCPYKTHETFEITVNTDKEKLAITAEYGENLYDVLKKNKVRGDYLCAGKGICGKCRVKITSGAPLPCDEDKKHLTPYELDSGERLACRVTVSQPMELSVSGRAEDFEIMTEGVEQQIAVESPVLKKHIILKKSDINDSRSDLKRIADSMGIDDMSAGIEQLRSISAQIRGADYDFTAAAYNSALIGVERGDTESSCFGAAIDIGTTTVVCYLVELAGGRTIDIEAQANTQSAYGADVISRIDYTCEHENGTQTLRNMIVGQINSMVEQLCVRNGIKSSNIYNISVAGNTAMIHFFLGLPSENIAVAPFTPVTTSAMDFYAEEIGLNTGGVVSVIPGIASYVGSDITAGILASGMTDSEGYSLLLDLGTNGEMVLGNSHRLITCSVAAGPAFEGGNIKYGVGGIRGAIGKVDLTQTKIYKTINEGEPVGICGSGVLDTVSELLKSGVVDETGRMGKSAEDPALSARLVEEGGLRQFVLEHNPLITFTQKDVREVQLAKAAFSAGINILLKETGLNFKDIEKVFIAGGFGNYMDMKSALNIGLIPAELKGKTVSIGNAAGAGAKLYLLSKSLRKKAGQIVALASYIELSSRADFQDYYVENMTFE